MSCTFRLVPAAAALLALGGCGDQGIAPPQPGDLAVQVYLDRDPASPGTFSAGDQPLAGVRVTLQPAAASATGAAFEATTDAQGVAAFTAIPAGQYRAALAGFTPPAGAVLAGSPTAIVDVPLRGIGTPVRGEFRFAFLPGSVGGTVFRDLNANGTYDAGTDIPGTGLALRLTTDSAGTQQVATTTVAANATYRFETVAPGTYFVQFVAPNGFTFGAEGTTRRVVVTANQASTVSATFSTITTPIATVRTLPVGTTVVMSGILTSSPGNMGTGTTAEVWLQDATGGVATFGVVTSDSTRLRIGTRVEVTATVANPFSGQFQLGTNANPPVFTVLGQATPVAPIDRTGAQLNALTDEGRLVRAPVFVVTSIGGGTGAAFTVVGTVDGVRTEVRVGSNLAGITRANFAVGRSYAVTGILSRFNATAQIKPRTAADIVLVP